jgi:hypothetical protein
VPARIPSDHDSIETLRATVERVGRTDRPKIALPGDADLSLDADDVVRLVIDGDTYHTRVETDFDGNREFRGAFPSPTLARDPDADRDHLPDWLAEAGIDAGSSVLVDVVTAGVQYGLRAPGTRAVYEAADEGNEGLSAIARDLED